MCQPSDVVPGEGSQPMPPPVHLSTGLHRASNPATMFFVLQAKALVSVKSYHGS